MKFTFERVENGWLITDHTEDRWGNPSVVSVTEDNEQLCVQRDDDAREFHHDVGHYVAESLSRALWEAFGECYCQSKRQGGMVISYKPHGYEEQEEEQEED